MDDVTDRWTQIQTLFDRALERPEDERTAWLRAACGSDPDLYAEVAELLEGAADEHSMFGGRAADLVPADALGALAPSRVGERVGPWVLGERVGSGGMGAVYRAARADAEAPGGFEQTAALKLVKPGMDSEAVLARFRAERQILARLEHAGIARLLDGGLASDDRPYFAMEFVDGVPVTDYADARRLSVDARLALFERVADAVAYAHRALVVHRDLKPSNVLVAEGDEGPVVKLLDFGIARVLSDDADGALTRTGQRVFTPGAAAPEQVRGEAPTTSTDVYALGVLLYRLLSGAKPVETLDRTAAEIERAVLDDVPQPPSTRVTAEAAQARSAAPSDLAQTLRGDLDTICLKALRKEAGRRYGSAAEMLADVRRYRDGFPIEARPATRRYRAGLFVKRHRGAVLGTAAALVALVALTAFYTTRLAGERDRARLEAEKASEVSAFLRSVFEGADPSVAEGDTITARALLDRGAARIESELADEPEVQAEMMSVVGDVYLSLGLADDAAGMFERALAVRRALPGADTLAAASLADLARARSGQGEYTAADSLYRLSLDIRRARLGDAHTSTLASLSGVARSRHMLGDYAQAESLYVRVLSTRRADPTVSASTLAGALYDLGSAQHMDRRLDDAEISFREAIAVLEAADSPDRLAIADVQNDLAVVLKTREDYDAAEPLYRDVLALRRRVLGDSHPETAVSVNNLAVFLRAREAPGDVDEAEALSYEAVEMYRRAVGEDHPSFGYGLNTLAGALAERGDCDKAVPVYAQAADVLARGFGEAHWMPSAARLSMASCLTDLGRYAESERALLAAYPKLRAALGDDSTLAALTRRRLAELYDGWGRPGQAARYRDG